MLSMKPIKFKKEKPEHEEIVKEIEKLSGLNIIAFNCEDGILLEVKEDESFRSVIYEPFDNEIIIYSFNEKNHYLKCVAIAALYNLGGEKDYELPKWAWMKWEDKKWWQCIRT